jgi:hypothetical protein
MRGKAGGHRVCRHAPRDCVRREIVSLVHERDETGIVREDPPRHPGPARRAEEIMKEPAARQLGS